MATATKKVKEVSAPEVSELDQLADLTPSEALLALRDLQTNHNDIVKVDVSDIHIEWDSNSRALATADIPSMKQQIRMSGGIFNPIWVSRLQSDDPSGKKYMLVDGFRRLTAASELFAETGDAKWVTNLNARIMGVKNEAQFKQLQALSSLSTKAHTPLEIAKSFKEAMKGDGAMTEADIALQCALSVPTVRAYIRLDELPDSVIELIRNERLGMGLAKLLLNVKPDEREAMADLFVNHGFTVEKARQHLEAVAAKRAAEAKSGAAPGKDATRTASLVTVKTLDGDFIAGLKTLIPKAAEAKEFSQKDLYAAIVKALDSVCKRNDYLTSLTKDYVAKRDADEAEKKKTKDAAGKAADWYGKAARRVREIMLEVSMVDDARKTRAEAIDEVWTEVAEMPQEDRAKLGFEFPTVEAFKERIRAALIELDAEIRRRKVDAFYRGRAKAAVALHEAAQKDDKVNPKPTLANCQAQVAKVVIGLPSKELLHHGISEAVTFDLVLEAIQAMQKRADEAAAEKAEK